MSINLHGANQTWGDNTGESLKNMPAGSTVDATVQRRKSGVASLVRGEGIDVFGVQEAKAAWLTALDEELNEFGRAGEATYTLNTQEGNFIYYRKDRFDVLAADTFWLVPGAPTSVSTSGTYKVDGCANDRICTWALLRDKETGSCFLFMNTHLDTAGDTVTLAQVNVLLGQISVILAANGIPADCPVMITGDMNSEPTTNTYAAYTSILTDTCVEVDSPYINYNTGYGYNYVDPATKAYRVDGHRIDYVFVSETVTTYGYNMIHTSTNLCPYGEYLTDHNAVIAQVGLD